MSKKKAAEEQKQEESSQDKPADEQQPQTPESKLPREVQEKLKVIKDKLDRFQKKVLEKFDKYIMGIALLPPPKPQEGKKPEKEKREEK